MIARRKKICVVCGNPEFLFSGGMCKRCCEITRSKSINNVTEDDLSGLIEDADALFSKYIRMKAAGYDGKVKCYTCGIEKRWQEQQCGHYISRYNLFLRWDERNAKVQCATCNCLKHGNIGEYTKRLELEFPGLPEMLIQEARAVYKPGREEIKALISELSNKVECLK